MNVCDYCGEEATKVENLSIGKVLLIDLCPQCLWIFKEDAHLNRKLLLAPEMYVMGLGASLVCK
jgi:hypothetical protein